MTEINVAKSVERIAQGMGVIPYMRYLGMEFVEGGEGYVKTRLRFQKENTTVSDALHGGAIASLIDTTGSLAPWTTAAPANPPYLGPTVAINVHYLSGVSIADNGRVAATNSTFYRPSYLVTFDLDHPDDITTLVDFNEDVLSGVKLGEVEEIWTESSDGLPVQGWLMKPADFEPGKEYPMLLWIHGGPVSMYSVRWNWNWQNFAADGYAVLWMNPRGSTGYGQDFVNGINYLYPGKDFDDLMAGVDAAIDRGFIDEDNLFVTGSSGGGVLTAWIVGHTDRFRAAVSQRPVINWHSFVGTTDGSGWYRRFESMPWEDPLEYAERSPLHYVGNVTTPTMLLSGEADLRTPIGQAEEFYRALKVLDKETLHVKLPDEYHGTRSVSHRLMIQLYLKAWFDKYRDKPIA